MAAGAPALRTGAIDYGRLLSSDLERVDFYDSREHLGTLAGSDLAAHAVTRAAALSALGLRPGDRVVMVAANTEHYLASLLAVLLLGAVPCAVAPPTTPSRPDSPGVAHLRAAVDVVSPVLVLTDRRSADAFREPRAVVYEDLDGAGMPPPPGRIPPSPGDPHHIQLTSGSTSAPKAVLLSHSNVVHNMAVIGHAMGTERERDRLFSWLPMYHDMGFIQVLGALIYRLPIGMMTPLGFLRNPLSWPRHMTAHASTFTAGPTFGYHAAVEALARSGDGGSRIDLTALRFAYVGAEPIAGSTLSRFTESFAPLGLRPDALVPGYGMAESVLATTIALTAAPPARGNVGRGRALRTEADRPDLISCGAPIDVMRIRIVDRSGEETPAGGVGDIQISGPSVMAGYLNADGSLGAPPEGWHDTGDRGLLHDGELYVVGRDKEMLIVRGRNLPPHDVEQAIADLPEVGPGNCVVFAVPDDGRGREGVVAMVATGPGAADDAGIRESARARIREGFGFSLDDVVVVPRGSIPRTTSGKAQRLRAREAYLRDRSPANPAHRSWNNRHPLRDY